MILETYATFMQKVLMFSGYVNNQSSFPKPLTSKQEEEYFKKMQLGDASAKDILINHNLRLVAHIVKKYMGSEEADDLISVGSLGLIKAINSFKLNMGTQFSTYAARCIENEILMLIRVNKKHKGVVSIEDILGADNDDNEVSLIDIVCPDEDLEKQVENNINKEKLEKVLIKTLNSREYEIICYRYGLKGKPQLTQREVAEKLKISRSYISRLEKKALNDLGKVIKKEDYFDI